MMAPLRLLPVLLLAACQPGGGDLPGAAPAMPAASPASLGAARAPASLPPPPPAPAPRTARGAAPDSAAALRGADAEAVIGIFGAPRLRRSEGSAEIWLYAGPQCHLDIVFYPGEDGGAPRVAHAGTRIDGDAARGEAECLAGIARRRT